MERNPKLHMCANNFLSGSCLPKMNVREEYVPREERGRRKGREIAHSLGRCWMEAEPRLRDLQSCRDLPRFPETAWEDAGPRLTLLTLAERCILMTGTFGVEQYAVQIQLEWLLVFVCSYFQGLG